MESVKVTLLGTMNIIHKRRLGTVASAACSLKFAYTMTRPWRS